MAPAEDKPSDRCSSDYVRLVERFFRSFLAKYDPLEISPTDDTPSEMLAEAVPDSPGWRYWRLVPWHGASNCFQEVERRLGIRYPEDVRFFLSRYHTLGLDVGCIRFPATPLASESQGLIQLAFERPWSQRVMSGFLLPIAEDGTGDYGPICIEAKPGDAGGRVFCWYLDCVETERLVPIFSSFQKLMESLVFFLEAPRNFFIVEEDETATSLMEKRRLFRDFLGIDPAGAGGLGREHWENYASEILQ